VNDRRDEGLSDQERALIERTKQALDRELEALDTATRVRLTAARRAALGRLEEAQGEERGARLGWLPTAAAVGVVVIAVGVALAPRPAPVAGDDEPGAEVELLLAEDELAFYEQDPEFYAWLDEQLPAGAGDAG